MNSTIIGFIVGYVIIINILAIVLMWIKVKTDYIKFSDNTMNIIFVFLSVAGGFIGVLRGREMLGYQPGSKLYRRYIPFLIFIEVCIVLWLISKNV